jgi:pilus assembly protein CpaF
MSGPSEFPVGLSTSPDLARIKAYLLKSVEQDPIITTIFSQNGQELLYRQIYLAYQKTGLQLSDPIRNKLFKDIYDELASYGPIQPLLDDPSVTEVMVNGPRRVYVERDGRLVKTSIKFENDEHVQRVIERIVRPLGRKIDAKKPTVDARLPDGSRVNAVIPPVAIDGPSITIRKFGKDKLTIEQLLQFGSLTAQMSEFLQACVVSRLNIVISGGTGSGKTTLLNVLSGFIPEEDRIVTIEDAAELRLHQEHVVRLETKPADSEGDGAISIRDLVRNSLRMRPDRIVVGECRGGEALDMLQAMNTGHDGSLTTLHANTPRDAISRLETMAMMSGIELPLRVVREQIASAVDVIVQQSRLKDGTRKITQITEVVGMEGDTVVLTDIFKFEQTNITSDGKVIGELKPTGIRPFFMPRLEAYGFKLRPEVFGANIAEMLAVNRRSGARNR